MSSAKLGLGILLSLWIGVHPAHSQGASAAFASADAALNDAWAKVKAALVDETMELQKLQIDQRNWIEYREEVATRPEDGAPGAEPLSKTSKEYYKAAAELTESRTNYLLGIAEGLFEEVTGAYSDTYGGTMQIVEHDGKLYFHIECVRGPTLHTGEIAGVASWNLSLGWFSDAGLDSSRTDVTNLVFINRGRKLEVEGANTGYYHGTRAYFSGEYARVGTLSEEERKHVIKAAKEAAMPSKE